MPSQTLSEDQKKAIVDALKLLGRAYEKSTPWMAAQLELWSESNGIARLSADQILDAARSWIDEETRPPMLAQFIGRARGGETGEARTPKGLPAQLVGGQVCPDCQGNGFIECAVWRTSDPKQVHVAALKCVCRGGEDPEVTRERWVRQEPTLHRLIFAVGRSLTPEERGCEVGKVIEFPKGKAKFGYTPNPERLDRHRMARQAALEQAKWEGGDA